MQRAYCFVHPLHSRLVKIRISSTGDAVCTRCVTYSRCWFGSGIWTLIDASDIFDSFCYPHLRVKRRHKITVFLKSSPQSDDVCVKGY